MASRRQGIAGGGQGAGLGMTTMDFDQSRHKWREVTGEPGDSYLVHHWYTILGHDQAG